MRLSLVILLLVTSPIIAQRRFAPPPGGPLSPPPGAVKPKPKALSEPIALPIVVFCRIAERPIPGFTVYRDDTWSPMAVVEVFPNGVNETGVRYTYNASDAEIRRDIGMEVAPVAAPFSHKRFGELLTADGDEDVTGRLPFLKDLAPYATARNTQHTERREVGYIEGVLRNDPKWLVPGGLEGVHGWKSRLLKSRNAVATVFLARPDDDAVLWSRSYPDGSVFADELRNANGKVFEVRVAEKRNGKWERFVAYKNHAEAPTGFRKFKSSECALCHDQAGHAAYGAVAVPGADGIISDPIPVVEAGGIHQDGRGTQSIR